MSKHKTLHELQEFPQAQRVMAQIDLDRLIREHAEMRAMLEQTPRWTDHPEMGAFQHVEEWIEWDKRAKVLLATINGDKT